MDNSYPTRVVGSYANRIVRLERTKHPNENTRLRERNTLGARYGEEDQFLPGNHEIRGCPGPQIPLHTCVRTVARGSAAPRKPTENLAHFPFRSVT